MAMNNNKLIIFGEVLYDCFPGGEKVLGGAPFNVAWHLQAFGQSPRFVSRVGDDAEGAAIVQAMEDWGMDTGGVQQDPRRATGRVAVSFNQGEPSYEIVADVAYDFIDSAALIGNSCNTLYHGSLGLRSATARRALEQLKQQPPQRIFMDVNLRPPWWRREQVLEWVAQANWVKLNLDELGQLQAPSSDLLSQARDFKSTHELNGLIITRGEQGALALTEGDVVFDVIPESSLDTVDSVGAGDAFSAVMLLGLNLQWPLDTSLQRAQSFASAIVGQRGATVSSRAFYRDFLSQWGCFSDSAGY
jgi:fructokinase